MNSIFPKNRSTGIGWLLSSSKKVLLSSCNGFFRRSAGSSSDSADSALSQLLSSSTPRSWFCTRVPSLSVLGGQLLAFSAEGFMETWFPFPCMSLLIVGPLLPLLSSLRWSRTEPSTSSSDVSTRSLAEGTPSLPDTSSCKSDFTKLLFSRFSLFEGCRQVALCEEAYYKKRRIWCLQTALDNIK